MNLLNEILGEHTLDIWGAGLIWTVIGIIFVKLYYYDRSKVFKLRFWINDNLIDVLLGILSSMLILRLGDYGIHLLRDKFNFEIEETTDFVVYMIVISALIQIYLHKKRKPISTIVEKDMHIHNENCKH